MIFWQKEGQTKSHWGLEAKKCGLSEEASCGRGRGGEDGKEWSSGGLRIFNKIQGPPKKFL